MPEFNSTLFGLDVRVTIDEEGTVEEMSIDGVFLEIENIRIASTKAVVKNGLTCDLETTLTLEDHFAEDIHDALEERRHEIRDYIASRGREENQV